MDVFHALKLAVVSRAIMMAVAECFAWAVHRVTGYSTAQLLLAYAPGGLNEKSLVSLVIQENVAFVATHHLVRILVLLALTALSTPRGKCFRPVQMRSQTSLP